MEEATKKEKTRLPSGLLRSLFCKLGFHKWAGIYTKYNFSSSYRIDWRQYCLCCPAERDNPVHQR